MAQHDYVIDNSTGANVRADLNSALQAIASNNSGSSAPSTTYAFQLFADTNLQKIRIRNSGNNAYVNLRGFDGSIQIPGGSQSSPSLSITDDTNTGIFSGGPDEINISTGGTERFVITNTGNCGIGTVNPATNLHIQSTGDTVIRATSADGNGAFLDLGDVSDPDGGRINYDNGSNLIFHTNSSERLRIDSSGRVGIGTSSPDHKVEISADSSVLKVDHTTNGDTVAVDMRHGRGGLSGLSGKIIRFIGSDNSEEGSIVINATTTSFNNSSDYRLKENETAILDGITKLKQLKPYRFNFKDTPSRTIDGFFAHEVSTAVPEAVFGEKDAVATEEDIDLGYKVGDIKAQQLDQSKLVPLLTAALQEVITKVEILEQENVALRARVTNLEGN